MSELHNSSLAYQTPTLFAKTSIGKTKYWIGRVFQINGVVSTTTEYWQDNGKHTESAAVFPTGKQKRTDLEQGIFEIKADMQRKLDKGYTVEGAEAASVEAAQDRPPILPMLAHGFADRGKGIVYPAGTQPKLNGIRALYDPSTKVFWTRQGNRVIAECVAHLHFDGNPEVVYDGELVLPAPYTFQQTIEAVKKYRGDDAPKLEYHLFDCYDTTDPDAAFYLRQRHISWTFGPNGAHKHPGLVVVPETVVENREELADAHLRNIAAGYEGTMVRNRYAPYKAGHRSQDLLKLKETQEGEYPITGFTAGQGSDAGAIIYQCVTPEGLPFNVRPNGSIEDRRKAYVQAVNDPKFCIGSDLTVKYQVLTDDGVPLFPVGLAVRNYE